VVIVLVLCSATTLCTGHGIRFLCNPLPFSRHLPKFASCSTFGLVAGELARTCLMLWLPHFSRMSRVWTRGIESGISSRFTMSRAVYNETWVSQCCPIPRENCFKSSSRWHSCCTGHSLEESRLTVKNSQDMLDSFALVSFGVEVTQTLAESII
jgi:hypothetical protein